MADKDYSAAAHAKEVVAHQKPMIAVGAPFPHAELVRLKSDGAPETYDPVSLMTAKHVVVFSVPGPFTPTCSQLHLAGFGKMKEEYEKANVQAFCLAVATPDVMQAWFAQFEKAGFVQPLADFGGELTFKMGLGMDASKRGLGFVPKRTAMVFEQKAPQKYVLKSIVVEPEAGQCGITSAASILRAIGA